MSVINGLYDLIWFNLFDIYTDSGISSVLANIQILKFATAQSVSSAYSVRVCLVADMTSHIYKEFPPLTYRLIRFINENAARCHQKTNSAKYNISTLSLRANVDRR